MPEGRFARAKAFFGRPACSLKAPLQKLRVLLSVGRLRGMVERVGGVRVGSGGVGLMAWTPGAGAEADSGVGGWGDLRRREGMSDLNVDD